jgi:Domain of unknown function (DUF4864)
MRLLTALTIITLAFIAAAPAQESRAPAPAQAQKRTEWQSVITKQIEAFRASDGAAALTCAGESFRKRFDKDPGEFYQFIANSDYSPIVKSSSHSFGEFKMDEDESIVLQIVSIVGRDQRVYKAIYEMTREAEGWKVQGVTQLIAESIVT